MHPPSGHNLIVERGPRPPRARRVQRRTRRRERRLGLAGGQARCCLGLSCTLDLRVCGCVHALSMVVYVRSRQVQVRLHSKQECAAGRAAPDRITSDHIRSHLITSDHNLYEHVLAAKLVMGVTHGAAVAVAWGRDCTQQTRGCVIQKRKTKTRGMTEEGSLHQICWQLL